LEHGDLDHQFLALRQKLMKWRIEQADGHRQSVHGLK
jgi:hypothetical protein